MKLVWALILVSVFSSAGGAAQSNWQGTWAATVGGTTFAGTWNAVPGQVPDTVTGIWSVRDQNGAELATGTWAAGRQDSGWKGTWQARRRSGQVDNGTWQTPVRLSMKLHLSDLFEAAMAQAVSGSWQMGANHAGAWTIRAYAQK